MGNYFENLDNEIKEYFNILSSEIPEFLNDYIQTPEMQKQAGISTTCGKYYSNIFGKLLWYSNLDHSVAVALIIWHFTKDKKQTLAGLFHDIATPAFKHCVDFMNGDYEKQEYTEELTTTIIKGSKQIMSLLKRDNISIEEVDNYHNYPIADNDTPRLSADRLEYTLSNALGVQRYIWCLDEIKEIYNDIEIQKNEFDIEELGFKTVKIAEKFVNTMSKLSSNYIASDIKFSMQFLADIMRKMSEKNIISKADLYKLSEKEIIKEIENCNYCNIATCFGIWKNATEVYETDEFLKDKYCVNIEKVKIRYINPLVKVSNNYVRIKDISNNAKRDIENALNFKTKRYLYMDFKL